MLPSHVDPNFGESISPLAAPLWSVARLTFSIAELVRVATHLGWLDDEIRWIIQCDCQREAAPPDDEAIQGASENFRYEHDLLTAEETERWLAERELSFDDFQLHCERLAVAATATEPSDLDEEPLAAAEHAGLDEDSWRVHLWVSGRMHEVARRCAWLLLAARENGQSIPDLAPDVATWRSWELLLKEQSDLLLAGNKVGRMLEAQRWPWTRVTVEVTEFSDEGVAREAELCLAENSATIEEIVAGTGAVRDCRDNLVCELETDWQEKLISLPVGGIWRLFEPDEPPRLIRMLARSDPTLDDRDVRAAVVRRLQEDVLGAIEREVITWEHPMLRVA